MWSSCLAGLGRLGFLRPVGEGSSGRPVGVGGGAAVLALAPLTWALPLPLLFRDAEEDREDRGSADADAGLGSGSLSPMHGVRELLGGGGREAAELERARWLARMEWSSERTAVSEAEVGSAVARDLRVTRAACSESRSWRGSVGPTGALGEVGSVSLPPQASCSSRFLARGGDEVPEGGRSCRPGMARGVLGSASGSAWGRREMYIHSFL